MNSFWNNYFGFNKQQRNGLLILCLISFTLVIVRLVYPYFIKPDTIVIKNLPLIERKLDSAYYESQKIASNTFTEDTVAITLFNFDPNTVLYHQLLQLGFKDKIAKTVLKFRTKGFIFKQKADLKKVYGITDALYLKLEPYIIIYDKNNPQKPENEKNGSVTNTTIKHQPKLVIELNSADSSALVNISGIGPAYAKRILKYRSLLGGYTKIEQLKEVYGFTDELYEKIKPFVSVNSTLIKKIDLNKDDFKTINKHPYLSYELTKTLFDWRKKTIITATNLHEIITDEVVYMKLLPYLAF